MKIRTFIATASLVASGSLVAFSGSAQAALYTTCVGDGGAVTVSNDLVVPAGKSCTLTGTKVKGSVTVEAGADLVAAGATFNGAVNVEEDAYLDLTDTTVKGTLTTDSAFGTHLEKSNLKAVDATEGFVYAVDSTLGGNVSTDSGELYVSGSTLNAALTGEGNQYTDVYDTTVKGDADRQRQLPRRRVLRQRGVRRGEVLPATPTTSSSAARAARLLRGRHLPRRQPGRHRQHRQRRARQHDRRAARSPRPATTPSWSWARLPGSVAPSSGTPPPRARRPPAPPSRPRRRTVAPSSPRRPPSAPLPRRPRPTRPASPASDAGRLTLRHSG